MNKKFEDYEQNKFKIPVKFDNKINPQEIN